MNLQSARKFEDLLAEQVDPAPYEYKMLFSSDGLFARQRSKRRFKLLKAIDRKLRQILVPGETVYFATSGTTATAAEQFFVGWAAMYINRRALVFTTERILLLQIDSKQRPVDLVSQIPVASLATVKATWTGTCQVKLVNREALNFVHVPSADRKFVAQLLKDVTQGTKAPFERGKGVEQLCPFCFASVPGHPEACPSCGGGFKSPKSAFIRSLIFPGLGDWYLGHRVFAVLEMIGSGFLWLVLVIAPLLGVEPEEGDPIGGSYWITVAIMIAIAHAIDAAMTRHFALKGHHPLRPPTNLLPPRTA